MRDCRGGVMRLGKWCSTCARPGLAVLTLVALLLAPAAMRQAEAELTAGPTLIADSVADFGGLQGAHGWYYGYYPANTPSGFQQYPLYNSE